MAGRCRASLCTRACRIRQGGQVQFEDHRAHGSRNDAVGDEARAEPRADHAGPTGGIHSLRPCFHWPAHPDAARYSFRLVRDDGATVIQTDLLDEPRYLRRAPANLEPGRSYRFEAKALGSQGDALGWTGEAGRKVYLQQGGAPVRMLEPTPELTELVERARLELDAAETAWVLAGYFATIEAPADVASALETYLDQAPDGAHAGLARALLHRLGCR